MVSIRGLPKQTGTGGGVLSGTRIVGIPEAISKLKGVDSVVRLNLGQIAQGAAIHMERLAKEYVPVISGNLQEGIGMSKVAPYSYEVSASSLDGGNPDKNDKEYAGYVEFGTSKMSPRFFMRRAWQDTYPLATAELRMLAMKIERL